MNDRSSRLRVIRRLVKNERVENQEELLERLGSEGFSLTQATLSRDLKLLKVGKVTDGATSFYALPDDEAHKESIRNYVRDVRRGWVSIDFSGNIGVISTLAGHANTVAFALDRMELPEILGTVAGDDTVIVVIREGLGRDDVKKSLLARFPGLDV